jgi:hypothetical protein
MENKKYALILMPVFLFFSVLLYFFISDFDGKTVWSHSMNFKIQKFSEECLSKSVLMSGGSGIEPVGIQGAFVTNISLNSFFERSVTSTVISNSYDVLIKFSKVDFKPSNEDLLSIEASLQRYKEFLEVNCV